MSSLATDSLWTVSMEAGNMMSGRPAARSAPGTDPVTPLPPAKDQGDPHVTPSNAARIDPGTPAKRLPGARHPQPPDWTCHANEKPGAGTYDEPSFGRDPGGPGPWRQV